MTGKNVLMYLAAVNLLVGCGNQLQTLDSSANDTSAALSAPSESAPVEMSAAQKMLADLESNLNGSAGSSAALRQKLSVSSGLNLNSSQISSILGSASSALSTEGLMQSNDLSAILPVFIGGASSGVGDLGLTNPGSISSILSLVGDSSLSSVIDLSGNTVSTDLVTNLSSSLFGNLSNAGLSNSNSQALGANTIISSLLGNLGTKNMDMGSLTGIIQSLGAGSVLGLGQLGNTSSPFSSILGGLGSGSSSGIMSLFTGLTSNGDTSHSLQGLLGAFASGSNLGLGSIFGGGGMSLPGSAGGENNQMNLLMASLLAGLLKN